MTAKIAEEWLNSCSGCEIAIVDMGQRLLDILDKAEFVHIPVLLDHKYLGQLGDGRHIEIPEADVGIISGGIRNEEHLEVAQEMRSKCRTIAALGTCATHGGIPALTNAYHTDAVLERYYSTETTDKPDHWPDDGVPACLDACYALDEKIKVDIYLPGCPPHPDHVYAALAALLEGTTPVLPARSVCDTCPTMRAGKGQLKQLRRFLQAPHYGSPQEPLDKMRCLLEQGLLCMGPVTRAGCGGDKTTPRCIAARVPCRGCYGPVKQDGNQLLDMLNALASNGIEIGSLPEHPSLLRFSGAHRLLRPARQGKES
ncbi:methyl viologen-reducing hydrogenase [Desulfoferrobacter suflitae]|uniref:NADH-quinone oxidoreductase subunit B family protein n=1 Tax=Desulfoferrobacter suflitae TaxID=2865782 RepID=UPI0021643321|nr:methyl viologen-reducing hydrogenase [Desulfoferrobacter suflitae]MCK8601288.1 methyl viologen-reducing hydrogenase [Desulfoferrobacter suflitae]